jgi:penicillin-binding protein 1B
MMKHTFASGTAAWVRRAGFELPAAGKTGTTSDTKDAWFLGFTPNLLTLTWVGYDDNTPTGLTGASGALPLWFRYSSEVLRSAPAQDFAWPEGTTQRNDLIFVEQ